MDTRVRQARILGFALMTAALALVSAPSGVQAQEMPEVSPETLESYTKLHVAINAIRDEYHGVLGRIHDTQGRDQVREEMDEKIAEAHALHEMTEDQYDQITLVISFDSDLRKAFDELVAELTSNAN